MVRRSAQHLFVAGALTMGSLLPGCQWPVWPSASTPTSCRRCELPCMWHCDGFSRCIDDKLAKCAAAWDAHAALRSVPDCWSSKPDYRDGFIDAFQDVAIGHPGDLPAIPPEKYWKGCFRTGPQAQLAQDWFAGYCDGAERARQCYGLNEVQVSAQGYPQSTLAAPQGMHAHQMPQVQSYGPGTPCQTCQGGRR